MVYYSTNIISQYNSIQEFWGIEHPMGRFESVTMAILLTLYSTSVEHFAEFYIGMPNSRLGGHPPVPELIIPVFTKN